MHRFAFFEFEGITGGVYVENNPDREIDAGKSYGVNLWGIVPIKTNDSDLKQAKVALDKYADIMRQADMDVDVFVGKEHDVRISMLRRFKRMSFDDLSYKSDEVLPVEVELDL